ncbi:MAG: hypothetical protein JSW67_10360 [Candidatus Latescibacterota bacterium]|nr:MAG: hypothetical protein JSW67_10360 [Candidatus Latescibacterota bacterium]
MARRRTEGEVRIYEDPRDNLTVDVENALLQERASQLRSEDSQIALLWNVFRSLQKLDPRLWLPRFILHSRAEPKAPPHVRDLLDSSTLEATRFHWWRRLDLPPSRHEWLREQACNASLPLEHYPARFVAEKKQEIARLLRDELPLEDRVEIPLCIETPAWMLVVLAVYKGNLRQNTRYDAHRDELLRVLDAGTWAAREAGKKFLSLVVYTDPRTFNTETKRLVDLYRGHGEMLTARLPHRQDHDVVDMAAQTLGELRWRDIGGLLLDAKEEQRIGLFDLAVIDELIKYLARKDLGFNLFRRLK